MSPDENVAGALWLARASAQPALIIGDWQAAGCSQIPCGRTWDAVIVDEHTGLRVITAMQRHRETIGPTLLDASDDPHTMAFLVPTGSDPEQWPIGAVVRSQGEALVCPMPGFTSFGRSWMVAPDGTGTTPCAVLRDVLAEVYAAHGGVGPRRARALTV